MIAAQQAAIPADAEQTLCRPENSLRETGFVICCHGSSSSMAVSICRPVVTIIAQMGGVGCEVHHMAEIPTLQTDLMLVLLRPVEVMPIVSATGRTGVCASRMKQSHSVSCALVCPTRVAGYIIYATITDAGGVLSS